MVEPLCEATFVRIVHAAAEIDETRVYDSGELLFSGLRYGNASPWLEVGAGSGDRSPYSMEFVSAASGFSVAHGGFSPFCPYIYTVVLSSPEQSSLFEIYHEVPFDQDISNFPPNTWKLGLIHAAPKADLLSIRMGVDEPSGELVTQYPDHTSLAVDGGTDSVWIRDAETEELLMATTLTGAIGDSRMMVIMDGPDGGIQVLVWDHLPGLDGSVKRD